MIDRMTAIKDACTLISVLRSQHGEVYFYLSPGRCGGTAPIYPAPVEMPPGADDMQIDAVDGAAFWLGREQRGYLAKLHLTMDLAPGNNCNFLCDDRSGQRFLLRMRRWTEAERQALAVAPDRLNGYRQRGQRGVKPSCAASVHRTH